MNEDSVHPFEVFYDPDTEGYYIFAPTGCVLVGGVAATIANQDSNQNVPLTALSGDFPTALYAHVTESTSGGATVNTVTFDGNATLSGAKYDFKVCSFGADENDGDQYDLCTSVVNLGGEGGSPAPSVDMGCWKIITAERPAEGGGTEQFRTFANRYFNIGEVTRHMTEYADGGDEMDLETLFAYGRFICLKVPAVPGLYDGGAPAQPAVVAFGSFGAMVTAQENTDWVTRPLYLFNSAGGVEIDFRATMPALQMTEVIL